MVATSRKAPAPIRRVAPNPLLEEVSSLRGCLKAVFDLIRSYGFRNGDTRSFDRTLAHWERGAKLAGGWVKFVKYKLAAYFSSHTDQELPRPPCDLSSIGDRPNCLLCGRAGRFLEAMLRRTAGQRRLGILASLKLSKKGMPRPGDLLVEQSVQSTVAKLTSPPERSMRWGRIDELTETLVRVYGIPEHMLLHSFGFDRLDVENQLRRTVHELFDGEVYTWADRVKLLFPSTSSNYINSRGAGGAVSYCVEQVRSLGLDRPNGYVAVKAEVSRSGGGVCGVLSGEDALGDAFGRLWWHLLNMASLQDFVVKPVGLAEALKVRVITKGNAAAQTVMRAFQRKLYDVLIRHPTFLSLKKGGDLSVVELEHQLGRLGERQSWLSGDYEAATDNLQSWVSEVIVHEVCTVLRMSALERDICVRLLTGHFFEDESGKRLRQRRGQLMGSIISFPILCIANAALCRFVVEMDRSQSGLNGPRSQKLTLQRAQMLINGDDLVIKVTPFGRWLWSVIGRETMGLIESVGKTYYSTEFMEMNSRLFMYDPVPRPEYRYYHDRADIVTDSHGNVETVRRCGYRYWHETPLINMGLLYGLVRSSVGGGAEKMSVSTTRAMSIGARCRLLLRECESGGGFGSDTGKRVRKMFLSRNSDALERARVPWFVPERLGGLGIPGRPSALDLRLCRAALLNDLKFTSKVDSRWLVWRYAQSQIREQLGAFERDLTVDERTAADAAANILVVNTIFDSLRADDLMLDERAAAKRACRDNERLWALLRRGAYGYPSLAFYKRKLGFFRVSLRYVNQYWLRTAAELPQEILVADDDVDFREELTQFFATTVDSRGYPFVSGGGYD